MLDAYIIDRIKRERERERQEESPFVPLHIGDLPVGTDRAPPRKRRQEDKPDRGVTIIDFQLR